MMKGAVHMPSRPRNSKPLTKAQRIFQDLRSKILSGELGPDLRLTLRPIASEYGTGINAASEAIKALSMEGLVRLEGKGGARVIARDLHRIRDEFILRMAIESETIRRVTGHLDDAQLGVLRRIAERVDTLFEEGESLDECHQMDVQFHLMLADFSRISQLRDALVPLLSRLIVLDQTASRTEEIPGQKHLELFEAIETQDRDIAVQAMRLHIEHSMNLSLALLHGDGELFPVGRAPLPY
jgi:DNA-binding GntR family transcriptional regulator